MAGHRTLVLGGTRSGKSRFAESLLDPAGPARYVATGYPPAADEQWRARVEAHRARRPTGWRTLETTDVAAALAEAGPPLLVDCLAVWLARTFDAHGWAPPLPPAEVTGAVDRLVQGWAQAATDVVAVSAEVGLGVLPAAESSRAFADALGSLNERLARHADAVWLVVAGLPLRLR